MSESDARVRRECGAVYGPMGHPSPPHRRRLQDLLLDLETKQRVGHQSGWAEEGSSAGLMLIVLETTIRVRGWQRRKSDLTKLLETINVTSPIRIRLTFSFPLSLANYPNTIDLNLNRILTFLMTTVVV